MILTCRLKPQQVLRLTPHICPHYAYHWGNYDASSGECCKMQTNCIHKTHCGKTTAIPNRCYKRVDSAKVLEDAYSKQLLEILNREQAVIDCDLFKHDMVYYRPSDKTRRYQRTWCECPHIWLRPKPICCYDKEVNLPMKRRPRPPPQKEKTAAEMYAFQMEQLCKYNIRLGQYPKLKCHIVKIPKNCTKEKAPFPSFSECDAECIPQYCPTECACKLKPNLCDMWKLFHHNAGMLKKCTEALVDYCPFKRRARALS
ncbi:uncharacterized protein LOC132791236 [Drosophila nasuta]|uniref:uncharacterized protein LOC132791236 n=1 Tax=Drosophila nasuta TaxID=42062 RepID=UPI00295E92C2|nr:uncharacterized protein LOC132791236 [Drosophila nasuta]